MSDLATILVAAIAVIPSSLAAILGYLNRRDIGVVSKNVDGMMERSESNRQQGDRAIGAGEESARQHARQVIEDDRKP